MAFENVVCEMASILSRPQCVNTVLFLTWDEDTWVEESRVEAGRVPFEADGVHVVKYVV